MTFGAVRFQLSKRCPGVDLDLIDGFINDAYQSILDRKAWKLLEADDRIATVAVYETGTIALVNGALAFTGTGVAFTAGMVGMGVAIPGRSETYRFDFTDATHGALDRPYEGPTAAASGFKLYQDIYELPEDFGRPAGVAVNQRAPGIIEHMERTLFERSLGGVLQFGEPEVYSLVMPGPPLSLMATEENDRARAQLYPIPQYAAAYPFTYTRRVPLFTEGDTENVFLPWVSTKAILDLARAAIESDRKNYTGAAAYTTTANVEMTSMLLADAKLRGPVKIRMAPAWTRHRQERAMRSAGAFRRLP